MKRCLAVLGSRRDIMYSMTSLQGGKKKKDYDDDDDIILIGCSKRAKYRVSSFSFSSFALYLLVFVHAPKYKETALHGGRAFHNSSAGSQREQRNDESERGKKEGE